MKVLQKAILFYLGGMGYMGLELCWRGYSHGTMFLAGGCAFLLLGWLGDREISPIFLPIPGAMLITGIELSFGLLFNQDHGIWDYTALPFSLAGQICPAYSCLWLALSLPAMLLYRFLRRRLSLGGQERK